jgi:magnesium chelatase subunit D
VLDTGEVALERDGFARRYAARFGVIALDEGMTDEERPPAAVLDRLAMHVDLNGIESSAVDDATDLTRATADPARIAAARAGLGGVQIKPAIIAALCEAASALGIASVRAPLLALRVARAAAAIAERDHVADEDAQLAARLVFASRVTVLPGAQAPAEPGAAEREESSRDAPPSDPASDESPQTEAENPNDDMLEATVVAAAQAAIPEDVLGMLQLSARGKLRALPSGRVGPRQLSQAHGRPAGIRKGSPGGGARLSVIETLRAAAPWQRVRHTRAMRRGVRASKPVRVDVRKDDFRIFRLKRRAQTTIIFLVDASGSAAMHRLAEVKGAVELLLADCYVRRDRVALIAFRRKSAELLLPPTRSLVRAKRSLAALAAGGGTPLASALDAARDLVHAVRHKSESPILVILTDGSPNIARDGKAGRERAQADALNAARLVRLEACAVLLLDTAPQPQSLTAHLANEMGARYIPLPQVRAARLSELVRDGARDDSHASGRALRG